jgi:hypothetical protein
MKRLVMKEVNCCLKLRNGLSGNRNEAVSGVNLRWGSPWSSWSLSTASFDEDRLVSKDSLLSRIAREKTSLRLFRAEKAGFKSESDSEKDIFRRSGGVDGPNLLKAARNLLAGEALSSSPTLDATSEVSAAELSL